MSAPTLSVPSVVAPAPPCPECTVALTAVGGGRHRYWTCGWCGTTMPRP